MSVNVNNQQIRIRANEASPKAGITFQDLCDLVDKGREVNVDPSTLVLGDTRTTLRDPAPGRDGYLVKYLEI